MTIIGFEERTTLRIKRDDLKRINKIVRKNQDLFFNESHFIRCAVLNFMRNFDEKGRKIK